MLATGGDDWTVRLWDWSAGAAVGEPLGGHWGLVNDVAFQSNQTLLTSSDDHTVRLWNLGFDSWVETGCRLVNRNLTIDEWDQGRTGRPYEKTCPDLPAGQGAPEDAQSAVYPTQPWRFVAR